MQLYAWNAAGDMLGGDIMEISKTTRVTDIICPNCGDYYLYLDASEILTSNPPQHEYYCTGCGFSHVANSDDEMRDWIKRLDYPINHGKLEDIVNHPSHYETGKFECFDVMREIYGDDFMKHFCIGNAFKYMYRFPRKNGVEDVRKAKRYLEIFLEIVDEEERNA